MLGNVFSQGMFTVDPNMTPEQLAQKRAVLAALQPRYGRASYVGEGLGQLAMGIATGARNRKLDKIESGNRDKANALFSGVLGGNAGPMNILGLNPEYGQAPANPNSPEQIGADTMAALGKDPASKVRQGLIARGIPEHIADGFVMNFEDESGLNPGINEIAPIVPGSRGGFGLAQWTGPRRKSLEAYAASVGKPVSDMNVQLDFLMQELQGPEAAAWQEIAAAQDSGTAAAAIVNSFLRPAEEHRARRVAEYTGGNPSANTAAPQIPMDQLMALMSNPWLAPEQRAMLQSMMDQQMQAGDPLRQIEISKAQAELDAMNAPQQPEQLTRLAIAQELGLDEESARAYALTGELPKAQGADAPAAFASLDMQAKAAGLVPGTPEYQEFMLNGGSSGTPAAFMALDMQAKAAGFQPGTPEYQEFMATRGAGFAAAAVEKGKAKADAEIAAPGDVATAQTTLSYIDSIRNHPGRGAGSGASSFLGVVPGTAAREFQIEVDRLKSGAFMTAIEQLRGMGALSNAEGQTATAAVAALDPSGSEEGFLKRLEEYESIVRRGLERAEKRITAPQSGSNQSTGKTVLKFNAQTGELE